MTHYLCTLACQVISLIIELLLSGLRDIIHSFLIISLLAFLSFFFNFFLLHTTIFSLPTTLTLPISVVKTVSISPLYLASWCLTSLGPLYPTAILKALIRSLQRIQSRQWKHCSWINLCFGLLWSKWRKRESGTEQIMLFNYFAVVLGILPQNTKIEAMHSY